MNSKYLKADASTAKRTATSLRTMAERLHSDVEAKGVLLAAARIADRIAITNKTQAALEKKKEDAFASAIARAKAEADEKIRTDWPLVTIEFQLALIRLTRSHDLNYVVSHITNRIWAPRAGLPMSYFVQEATQDLVNSIAYAAINKADLAAKKTDVVPKLCEAARQLEHFSHSAEVKAAADAIASFYAKQQEAA